MRSRIRQLTLAALLGALAFLPGASLAMEENLFDLTLCLAREQIEIDLDEPGALDLLQFAGRVYDELKRQLVNAAVPFEEELPDNDVSCIFSTAGVYAYVGATAGPARAWLIKVEVSDDSADWYFSWVEIWNSYRYGLLTGSDTALADDLFTLFRQSVRDLVDDYQDVN